jgi:hypothetical protein
MGDDLLGVGKSLEALDHLTKEGRELLAKIAGPSAEELGYILAEKLKLRRLRNLAVILREAKSIMSDAGLEPHQIRLKILHPLLEQASLENDRDLVSKWAGLLASASTGVDVHPSYSGILGELTPLEARLLDSLWEWHNACNGPRAILSDWIGEGFTIETLKTMCHITDDVLRLIDDNLQRLRLWHHLATHLASDAHLLPLAVALTPLGYNFVMVCRGPVRQDSTIL